MYDPTRNTVYDAYHVRVCGSALYKDEYGPMRVESQKLHEQARRLREYEMNEVIKMKESQLKRFMSDIVVADVPVSKDRLATDPNGEWSLFFIKKNKQKTMYGKN